MISSPQIEIQKIVLFPGKNPDKKFETAKLKDILESKCSEKTYYCSEDLNLEYISGIDKNSLLQGFYKAYVNHCPICITPDILWMLVIQGFSRHVEMNAETLRNKFVNFQGQKELVVDGTYRINIEDITKEEWEKAFETYVEKIRDNVGGLMISLLTPCFTTSTKVIQNACQVAIMSTFKNYFKYIYLYGGCGFPYIILKGSEMDYLQLKMKIQGLFGYLIDDWVKELDKVLDKILETKRGNIDTQFWKDLLKNNESEGIWGSGETIKITKINGWLLKFYPFIKERRRTGKRGEYGGSQVSIVYTRRDLNSEIDIRYLRELPDELINAPLTMVNVLTGQRDELSCMTGFIGIKQDKDYLVTPEIGCFVCKYNNAAGDDE